MANIPSVAKRARQALKRRDRNASLRAELRTSRKKMQKFLDSGDIEGVKTRAPEAFRLFDRMVSRGIIHKNNAARSKSRLMKKVRSLIPDYQMVAIVKEEPKKKEAPAKKVATANKKAAAPAKEVAKAPEVEATTEEAQTEESS
ncbi:30S ribosomal protein S20 [bacterium]|nr:30S ribosomal protein S20 [bacterium]